MSKKRTVILFGAGAIRKWNGIQTNELTDSILNSAPEFICNDNGSSIMRFLYDIFIKNGYRKEDINFETLINAVEELIIYYSYFDKDNELPSILKVLFNSRYENQILNFSIKGGVKKHGYSLQIPENIDYDFAKFSLNSEAPEQFYFQHLLNVLLTVINSKVTSYSYHSSKHSNIYTEDNSSINKNFQKWIQKLSVDSIIRMYSLNYDRLFKILSADIGLNVFEGFEYGDTIPTNGIKPEVKRIISDYNSHTHYNLHGSAYWNVYSRNQQTQLISPFIALHPYPKLNMNNPETAVIQMEKGKNIVLSNIITGFQKTQKSAVTPFKQMHSSFDRDCCFADELIVIGYSFGDTHINSSINAALNYNPGLKLYIIDPAYCKKNGAKGYDLLINRLIHIFPEVFNFEKTQPVCSNNNDTCSYFNDKLTVSAIGFDKFLEF
jgi:hypothetical protein